ncbi:MAG: DUF1501 domain-containing protein [Sedimentisphaerales bacterium]|nr:DUF1501 domain-containing protein [Sedimentisphaerales bacterium]
MDYTRREFLRGAAGVSIAGSYVTGAALASKAESGGSRSDKSGNILVVVQLSGGNDGLNTVVPYGDDEYARNRPTLRLPQDQLHKIDSYIGFHPRMESFMRLYKAGHLSIVQGVGSPNPDQSHENAMRMRHTADTEDLYRQRGWLGRAVDNEYPAGRVDAPAVFVGPIARPFALNAGSVIVPSIRSSGDMVAVQIPGQTGAASEKRTAGGDESLPDFVRQCRAKAYANSKRIEAALAGASGSADYPAAKLAGDLRTAAQLIRAEVGIRIFFVEIGGGGIGGFDNHANQKGNHCSLVGQLSESIAAFVGDLRRDKLLDRVLLMTFTEFGRTVKENGRRGTGHGIAGPAFLVGGAVSGGLCGRHPSLTDLQNGSLKMGIDFRRVYATVLDGWLGIESQAVLDKRYEPLDFLDT